MAVALSWTVVMTTGCTGGQSVRSGPSRSTTETLATVQDTVVQDTVVQSPGPYGVGDSLFPDLGNSGVDVVHYDVQLVYDHATDHLDGTVTMDVQFTTALRRFTLDSLGPDVTAVTVDGAAATFRQAPPELFITPLVPIAGPRSARVQVVYRVDPRPAPSAGGLQAGWFRTAGGSYVENEPEGARTWLPCNDHPSDKATYTFHISVPNGVTAVANGALRSHSIAGTRDVWEWDEARPMATYLISVLTGHYDLIQAVGPHGLPLTHAVLHSDRTVMQQFLDATNDEIAFYETQFGPYPLDRYGVSISDSSSGIAMETQERSLFSRDDFRAGKFMLLQQTLLSHELSHQWFGDAVSPARWRDVWLNESFATYAQWLWLAHIGFATVNDAAQLALSQRGKGSSADPTVDSMFTFNSYDGGAIVLHALRLTIGDELFFALLRHWVADNNGESRTTQDFIALAERVSGRDLTPFFDAWLFADHLPTAFPG